MNTVPITLAGNTADAPDLRYTTSGRAVARVRVAVTTHHQDDGRWVDGPTSWHTVIAWGALAENLAESVTKGDRILVHGRLEQRAYTTQGGVAGTVWEVTADEIGISLRYATARPHRAPRSPATSAPTGAPAGDAAGEPPASRA